MRRYYRVLLMIAVLCLMAAGCRKKEETDIQVYYLNSEGTALVTEGYNWQSDQTSAQIDEVLQKLKEPEDSVACTPAVPADVLITDCVLEGNKLDISFSQEYELLDKPAEVLLRAAVVKSLTQIDGIQLVRFHVGGELLKNSHGAAIGYMQDEDFAQNTGAALNSYQQAEVTLYYADAAGKSLAESKVSLRYNSYMTIEKAIIERLIKGPEEDGMKATLPAQTKLLGVSIKDDICYVNLDDGFLTQPLELNPELIVYSLVNSVIAGGNCSQVQISIGGDPNVSFQGQIDFSKPFEKNMEIVEE